MSSRSLMILRSVIQEPDKYPTAKTGDLALDQLISKWTPGERAMLKEHDLTGALPKAVNEMFLSDSFVVSDVRDHPILGQFIGHLSDEKLQTVREKMLSKGKCSERVEFAPK